MNFEELDKLAFKYMGKEIEPYTTQEEMDKVSFEMKIAERMEIEKNGVYFI